MNNGAGTTQMCAISSLLPQSINGGKCSGPGLYRAHSRNLCSWCFPEHLFSWYCCLRGQQDTVRSALVFSTIIQNWMMEQLWLCSSESGTVSRGKADGPWLQRSCSFSFQPGCVGCGQDLGKSFHTPILTSPFCLLFLICLCCSITQLGLCIWWLWGRSFLSYHCLGAVESLSPLLKSGEEHKG